MPAVPPEVLEAILLELPANDADTIPTLLACSLVSHYFGAVAKVDSIWRPIARHCWKLERAPRYVRLSSADDRLEMERSSLGTVDSPSFYERLTARPVIKRIIQRHLELLHSEPKDKRSHVLALVELGENNSFPFLDKLVFLEDDQLYPGDWLARRHWARQVRGAISRRKAIDVWKRIGEGWDGSSAFCEGVWSFSAFHGSANPDDVDWNVDLLTSGVRNYSKQLKAVLGGPDSHEVDPTLSCADFLRRIILEKVFHIKPFEDRDDPAPRGPSSSVECFANCIVARYMQADEDELLTGDSAVYAALLCAAIDRANDPHLIARPLHWPDRVLVAVAWLRDGRSDLVKAHDYVFLQIDTPVSLSIEDMKHAHRQLKEDDMIDEKVDFEGFATVSSAKELIRRLALFILSAVGKESDDFSERTGPPKIIDVNVLAADPAQRLFKKDSELRSPLKTLKRLVSILPHCFPWDSQHLIDVFIKSPQLQHLADKLDRYIDDLGASKIDEATEQRVRKRAGLRQKPVYRVGDIVKARVNETSEWQMGAVTGWAARYRYNGITDEGKIEFLTSLEQDDEDGSTYIVLPEIKAINVEKPGEKEQRKLFNVLLVDGREMIGVMTDTKIIRPCIVGWSKISRFCELDNIGKYFKRVDRSGRLLRFTMAEDHKKLYPDD